MAITEPDVYINGNNGDITDTGRKKAKLRAVPIRRTVFWEEEELFLPAVYVGPAGVVLDICAKIPVEAMISFLEKWNKERRLSLNTMEDFEEMDADNPGSRSFAAEVSLNGAPLTRRMGSSVNWYPEEIFRAGNENQKPAQEGEWDNPRSAKKLMEAYDLDRKCCWHFARLTYDWKGEPILSPESIFLRFQEGLKPVTVKHFTTDIACSGETIELRHPEDGKIYKLTLDKCEYNEHSFAGLGAPGMLYPKYNAALSYRIEPEIDRSLFDLLDCVESDSPRPVENGEESAPSDGPTAVFMAARAGKGLPSVRTAASSLHFEPAGEIRWRAVFRIKPKADMEISLPL